MTMRCASPSLRLADVQPVDLAAGAEVKPEVGPEVTPPLGVELPHHLEPVGAHPLEGGEALVAERIVL